MRDEPVARAGQTAVGVVYAVSEDAPEQVRTLIEGLQAPTRPGREVTWGEHPFEVLDAVDIEVAWDEATQRVTYSVPGAQGRSVPASALAEELDRDWERYLKDCVLVVELLGRLDAVTPAGIDTEDEITTWFDPQARTVVADIELAPVPTPDGLSTPGLRGRITVSSHAFDLDLEGASPATQLSEADARMVLSDAVREMTDAEAAATILGMRQDAFNAASRGIELGLRGAEEELANRRKA